MLGLGIRLAQSLGLHKECPPGTSLAVKNERSKTWWAVVWQDSLLSITYDRASSSSSLDGPTHFPPDFTSGHGNWTFEECMYRLCSVSLDIVRERHTHHDTYATLYRMVEHEKELSDIMAGAADYIRNSTYCHTEREKLQHWAFYLHKSYIVSELCRPAIGPAAPKTELSLKMRRTCIDNLAHTVQAWLGLNNLTPFACRSWAAMHRSLSSALLLGILGEPAHNANVRFLLAELLRCLEEITSGIDPTEVSAPIDRSIYWLRKLSNSVAATPAGSSDGMFDLGSEDSPYALMDRMIWGVNSPA